MLSRLRLLTSNFYLLTSSFEQSPSSPCLLNNTLKIESKMEALYTAHATSVGGRAGKVTSSDGVVNFDLRPPVEMGGPGGNYSNPEQLFAAGYAACFAGAYGHVALEKKIRVRPEITANVTINKVSDGFKLSVVMDVHVSGIDKKVAEELAEEAHAFCPYSRATKGNIDVKLNVTVD